MNEFLKKYIGDVNLSEYKYLQIIFKGKHGIFKENNGPGFNDQIFQLKLYLMIAYELDLILILPNRNLQPNHNDGKKVPLVFSDYYDLDSIRVNDELVRVVESIEWRSSDEILTVNGLVRTPVNDNIFYLSKVLGYNIILNYNPDILEYVKQFVNINKIEGCIHIRRTDRCKFGDVNVGVSGSDWDTANRPESILALLDETNAPRNIYIMTDMPDGDQIINELRDNEKYNFMFLYDFPELVKIKNKNNYRVFNIETCIMLSVKYQKHRTKVVKFYMENFK